MVKAYLRLILFKLNLRVLGGFLWTVWLSSTKEEDMNTIFKMNKELLIVVN